MARIVDMLMSRTAFILVAIVAAAVFSYDIYQSYLVVGTNVRCWNLPNITVTFALILALYLARQVDGRMKLALHELWLQGTLPAASDPEPAILQRVLSRSTKYEILSALLMLAVMALGYAWALAPAMPLLLDAVSGPNATAETTRLVVLNYCVPAALGLFAGLVAGAFFGRVATYGSVAAVLASPATALNIRPQHFDGANGLKPVGDFYLFQALLTAIPLLWLSGWALAIGWYYSGECFGPVDPAATARLSYQFYGQWLVVACFCIAGFVWPVLKLRGRLKRARQELLRTRVPEIEADIARLNAELASYSDPSRQAAVANAIADLAKERWSIRNMHSWPMDKGTFSKYAPVELVSNVAPVLIGPLLGTLHGEAASKNFDLLGVLELLRHVLP